MSSDPRRAPLGDDELRRAALSPAESWMLQAPAGSGKTELLMQRFLACLATVDEPESVLAITFTRKAAAEMHNRILSALQAAAEEPAELENGAHSALPPHRRQTRTLAEAVLKRSASLGWNLLAHPGRLQIRTLDSFCQALAQRAPFKDRLGGAAEVAADAQPLYELAAERLLHELGTAGKDADAVAVLLAHLDAELPRARGELARMLQHRDQWLPLLGRSDELDQGQRAELRERMEAALALSVEEEAAALRSQIVGSLSREQGSEFFALLRYRAEQATNEGEDASAEPVAAIAASAEAVPIAPPEARHPLRDISEWPAAVSDALPAWRAVASFLLLKSTPALRKSVNVNDGFPVKTTAQREAKKRCLALLESLAALPAEPYLCIALDRMRRLPEPRYSDDLWEFMLALLRLLPLAVAHLRAVFAERGVIDFAEYTQRALDAIGTEADPTELGLQLGYRIRHILVDEFQDTSRVQVELLARLLGTWEQDERCSTFLVGDPMQSIYSFRQADVAIFQRARGEGIGARPHRFDRLRRNFRSQEALVEWFNQHFPALLREENDATNAVRYAEAEPVHPRLEGTPVAIRGFAKGDCNGEARHLAACIRSELAQKAGADEKPVSIAVLVRTRSHLPELVQALREAGIGFRAVKTDRLSESPLVREMEALRAALSDLADRTAWLAVLRAPWCGLELADLWELCRGDEDSTVRELLRRRWEALSPRGRGALARVLPVMDDALEKRGRTSLRSLVESAWLKLGGPACLEDPKAGARVAECYFALLDEMGYSGALADAERFPARLEELFAPPDPGQDIQVEITTIHNAKGLEWDVVFLPALERVTRREEKRLLYWRPLRRAGEELLLLGAMEAAKSTKNAGGEPTIESYLRRLEREAAREERKRLLYVGVTRARRRLYLSACVDPEKEPKDDSMLRLLWEVPEIKQEFLAELQAGDRAGAEEPPTATAPPEVGWLRRLPPALTASPAPSLPPPLACGAQSGSGALVEHEFQWAGELPRRAGIVAHAFLERIATDGLQHWDAERLAGVQPAIEAALRLQGVSHAELGRGRSLVVEALRRTLEDERGRWLLSSHPEARCEWALTGFLDGECRHVRVDRTFVADGTRWLIDYKLSPRTGGGREQFLAAQVEKYRPDLEGYARVLRALEPVAKPPRPVRCALYFPLMGEFCEVKLE